MENEDKHMTPAERMYSNHLKNVANYYKRHSDKLKVKREGVAERRKADPEAHQKFLEKRRIYYKAYRQKKRTERDTNAKN